MKKLLLCLTLFLSLNGYAQIAFEKGYYIDNKDKKIDCEIKNLDWKNNPTEIIFKLPNTNEATTLRIGMVKEFSISNSSKHIRATVMIDRSSDEVNQLTDVRKPTFKEEQLFLKVLVEGEANLYYYEASNIKRFFYKTPNSKIEQLVYKSYKNANKQIAQNNRFRQQLTNDLKCSNLSVKDNMDYKKKPLVAYFTAYNSCNSNTVGDFKAKRKVFNLNIRPGINSASLKVGSSTSDSRDAAFERQLGFRFGLEAEVFIPYKKNTLSILLEPTYQSFKAEKTTEVTNVSGGLLTTVVDYTSIEFPIGFRYYFLPTDKASFFTDAALFFDLPIDDSLVEFIRADRSILSSLPIKSINNFSLGLGYNYNNKFSLELRYQTNRDILGPYIVWKSKYQTISLILGYSLF